MPPLTPPQTNDPLDLLRAIKYGLDRDDHDGYELVRACVEQGLRAFAPKRFKQSDARTIVDTETLHRYRLTSATDALLLCELLNERTGEPRAEA